MKSSERHHLKENNFAHLVGDAGTWLEQHRTTVFGVIGAVVLVGGGLLGYTMWQRSVESKAGTMLAEAMVIDEGRVQPPAPPAGTTNDPTSPGGQLPGTYPTLQAKHEAALPKFMAAADAYPTTQAGLTARLHAAETLAQLGRRDEAIAQYDRLASSSNPLIARAARLGKSSVQLLAGQFDPAIATLKEMAEQKDSALPTEALLMELARAYRLAGKTEDAKKTLTQVVEQHADSPFASEAKAEIAKLAS
jgi:tetratricopeptide (TPR) repeat protein